MSYEIHADHSQQFLLPPALEDWVPCDHPARFIRDFVEQLNLGELGFHQRAAEPGRPNYSSELLLSVWLYGYLEKIRSPRKLEQACRTHMPLLWLTGMHYPDHNTLWRFWKAHRKALKGVFAQSVKIARHLGMVGMVVHALDGTKIMARASSTGALHRTTLEELYAAIEASIAAMESAIEVEGGKPEVSSTLPESLHEAKQRRAAIQEALSLLDQQEQKHALPGEPEARMMMMHGRTGWGYNAQAVVDEAHGIVVGTAVTNQPTDYEQLTPMLDTVEEIAGGHAATTVADAGYRSAEQEVQAYQRGRHVLLPEHGRDADDGLPYHKSRFTYNAERDCYYCPQGKTLVYSRTIAARGNNAEARVYRCRECRLCPVRSDCTRDKNGRTIRCDIYEDFRQQQREVRAQPKAQALLKRRKAIVEPLFGHIKENLGFRRWTARGLENARAQWDMLCLAVNLQKIYSHRKSFNHPKIGPKSPLKGVISPLRLYQEWSDSTFRLARPLCPHAA
jgi:transposase